MFTVYQNINVHVKTKKEEKFKNPVIGHRSRIWGRAEVSANGKQET